MATNASSSEAGNNQGLELVTEHMEFVHSKTRRLNQSIFHVLREVARLDTHYASNVFGLRRDQILAICAVSFEKLAHKIDVSAPLFVPVYAAPTGGYSSLLPYVISKMPSHAPTLTHTNRWRHIAQIPRDLVREYVMTYREMANADLDQAAAAVELGRTDIRRLRDRPFSELMRQIDVIDPRFRPTVDDPANLHGNQARNLLRHLNRDAR